MTANVGEYINGEMDSITLYSEFILPNSSFVTHFDAIERIAMNDAPPMISTIGPTNICHSNVAKANT